MNFERKHIIDQIAKEYTLRSENSLKGESILEQPLKNNNLKFMSSATLKSLFDFYTYYGTHDIYDIINKFNKLITITPDLPLSIDIQKILKNAKSTALIVHERNLNFSPFSITQYELNELFKSKMGKPLCENIKYRLQKSCGEGSATGFLIKSKKQVGPLLLTCAHVFKDQDDTFESPENFYAVFNYVCDETGAIYVNENDVIKIKKIVDWYYSTKNGDWAIVKLDRNPEGIDSLDISIDESLESGQEIYMIGHPLGLSVKCTMNAKIRNTQSSKDLFITNLDAFGGNSGSPIFDLNTHKVIGMLRGGEKDFFDNGSCISFKELSENEGEGEFCQKLTFQLLTQIN